MPIHMKVDHEARLLVSTAEGDISKAEFEDYLYATVSENTGSYRKLFDGRFATTHMASEDVFTFGLWMKARHDVERSGPLAVVMQPHHYELVSRVLGMLATADRPMCLFEELATAQKWLESDGIRDWANRS